MAVSCPSCVSGEQGMETLPHTPNADYVSFSCVKKALTGNPDLVPEGSLGIEKGGICSQGQDNLGQVCHPWPVCLNPAFTSMGTWTNKFGGCP